MKHLKNIQIIILYIINLFSLYLGTIYKKNKSGFSVLFTFLKTYLINLLINLFFDVKNHFILYYFNLLHLLITDNFIDKINDYFEIKEFIFYSIVLINRILSLNFNLYLIKNFSDICDKNNDLEFISWVNSSIIPLYIFFLIKDDFESNYIKTSFLKGNNVLLLSICSSLIFFLKIFEIIFI